MAQADELDMKDGSLDLRLPTKRVRTVLPIYFGESLVFSIPDSGSEENIISARLATELGLHLFDGPEDRKEFRLADSRVITALGRVEASCAFTKKGPLCSPKCTFWVFQNLVSDLIMGMAFLDATETLNKNRHRLKKHKFRSSGPMQIRGINNPRRRVHCTAFHKPVLANADTGSDMNLVSLAWVRARQLALTKVDGGDSPVQFADGQVGYLTGKVEIPFIIWDGKFKRMLPTFYVLDRLTYPLLIRRDLLDQTLAFRLYRTALTIEDEGRDLPEISTILWFNTPERFLAGRRHIRAPEPLSGMLSADISAICLV